MPRRDRPLPFLISLLLYRIFSCTIIISLDFKIINKKFTYINKKFIYINKKFIYYSVNFLLLPYIFDKSAQDGQRQSNEKTPVGLLLFHVRREDICTA